MSQPKISIIVPIYNVEKYLHECLDSIIRQPMEELEIICVNDGSTDNSPAIVDEYAAKDSRVIAVHKKNGGYASGINYGLDVATGEYIAIVESDDYIAEDMMESLYDTAVRTQADVVISDYMFIDDSINKIYRRFNYAANVKKDEDGFFTLKSSPSIIHKPAYPWHKLYRMSFLKQKGIRMREDNLGAYQDQPWNAEILSKAERLYHIPKPLYFYRLDAAGSSTNIGKRSMINYLYRRRQAREILIENGAFTEDVKEYFYLSAYYGCDFFFQRIHNDFKKEYYEEMQRVMLMSRGDGLDYRYFNHRERRDYRKRITQGFTKYRFFSKLRNILSSERSGDGRHKYFKLFGKTVLRLNRTPLKFRSLIRLIDGIIPKNAKEIVFFSLPGYSDNPKCLYEYIKENHPAGWDMVWLRPGEQDWGWDVPSKWVFSWAAAWKLLRAKYIVLNTFNDFQHLVSAKNHTVMQLWHGMPIKTIGYLEKNIPEKIFNLYKRNQSAHFFITSDIFRQPMLDSFRMQPERLHVTGQARNDCVLAPKDSGKIQDFLNRSKYEHVIIYTPTYKEFQRDGVRDVDQEFANLFYMDDYSEEEFNKKLVDEKILLLVKPHPLDEWAYREKIPQSSGNIRLILNGDLNRNKIYFYDLFHCVDAMITDYSSISIDFILSGKPVIYLTGLLEQYSKNRGFIQSDNLDEYMPGEHVENYGQLVSAIDDALHQDKNRERRIQSQKHLHKYIDAQSSKRIYELMRSL